MNTEPLKYRAHRKVRELARFAYLDVYARILKAQDNGSISDKEAGNRFEVSERQVRKARMEGMNAYMADHFCVRGLGVHPVTVFGEEWWVPEAYYAEEVYEGEVDPSDLTSDDVAEVEAEIWEEMDSTLDRAS